MAMALGGFPDFVPPRSRVPAISSDPETTQPDEAKFHGWRDHGSTAKTGADVAGTRKSCSDHSENTTYAPDLDSAIEDYFSSHAGRRFTPGYEEYRLFDLWRQDRKSSTVDHLTDQFKKDLSHFEGTSTADVERGVCRDDKHFDRSFDRAVGRLGMLSKTVEVLDTGREEWKFVESKWASWAESEAAGRRGTPMGGTSDVMGARTELVHAVKSCLTAVRGRYDHFKEEEKTLRRLQRGDKVKRFLRLGPGSQSSRSYVALSD